LLRIPVVAVIGRKKSGKTTLIKSLIRELGARGFKVMSAKHVDIEGFTIDREGTDTWWHSKAGANPVVCVSNSEIAIIYKKKTADFKIENLARYAGEADIVLMEGFSRWTLTDESIAKIVMLRKKYEREEYSKRIKGPILCFCSYSLNQDEGDILNATRDFEKIIKKIEDFINKKKELYAILEQLPGLNCGRCPYRTCLGLAKAVQKGEASIENCTVEAHRRKLKSSVLVNGKNVPMIPYISELIRRTVLAMASTLKGIDIEGNEYVQVRILKKSFKDLENE